jgi:hypothetical protein
MAWVLRDCGSRAKEQIYERGHTSCKVARQIICDVQFGFTVGVNTIPTALDELWSQIGSRLR